MLFYTKFFALFLISFPILASGGSIKGKVTDKSTSEALIGANVVVQSQQIGAATDINGLYIIKDVPAGTYTIKASYVGYKPIEQKNVVIKNFQVVELNFELESDFTLAECIVVSERPLMIQSSTNCCRVISSENISSINVRGGRSSEVGYYVEELTYQVGGYNACFGPEHNTEEYSKISENIFK